MDDVRDALEIHVDGKYEHFILVSSDESTRGYLKSRVHIYLIYVSPNMEFVRTNSK